MEHTFVQLREKHLDHDAFLQEAKGNQELCAKYQVPFVLDDDVELALEVGADGVHVGQSDMEAGDVRAKLVKIRSLELRPDSGAGDFSSGARSRLSWSRSCISDQFQR